MSGGMGVAVAGVGARTAVGKTAPASAAAVRAGIIRVGEHPFLFDTDGEPIQVARPSYLEIDVCGSARLAQLAGPAAAEALGPLASLASRGLKIPIFVGLPSPRPGRPLTIGADISVRLQEELSGAGLRPSSIRTVEIGHAAGTMAVEQAWRAVSSGETELALAGGVDSYLEVETMSWLRETGQIHGAEQNSWGFVPGEAAGFVLLAAPHVAERLGSAAIELLVVATAHETKLIKTDAVCLGEGLTALFRALAAGIPLGRQVDDLVCDMNGEPYRADEFGFAALRAGQLFRNASAFATPASSWGDVGAASGPLFLALADAAIRRRYSTGPVIAAFTSAESGERSGFVVSAVATTAERRHKR